MYIRGARCASACKEADWSSWPDCLLSRQMLMLILLKKPLSRAGAHLLSMHCIFGAKGRLKRASRSCNNPAEGCLLHFHGEDCNAAHCLLNRRLQVMNAGLLGQADMRIIQMDWPGGERPSCSQNAPAPMITRDVGMNGCNLTPDTSSSDRQDMIGNYRSTASTRVLWTTIMTAHRLHQHHPHIRSLGGGWCACPASLSGMTTC